MNAKTHDLTGRIIATVVGILVVIFIISIFSSCDSVKPITTTIVTVKHDTLVTKEIHKDSTIRNIYSRDTVFIRDSRLTIKYLYKGDSNAFIGGLVASDTVIKVYRDTLKQTTIIKLVDKPLDGWDNFCRWLVALALAGGLIYLGIKNFPAILKVLKGGL